MFVFHFSVQKFKIIYSLFHVEATVDLDHAKK